MVFAAKKKLRQSIIEQRDAIDLDTKAAWDKQIFNTLVSSDYYQHAHTIFTFVSFGSEVDTHRLIKFALDNNKTICVPKIASKKTGMQVLRINGFHDLDVGYFKILEPVTGCQQINPEEIDLILMPGLAFNRAGDRLGYGGGFYDRFLTELKQPINKIALAYHFQVVDNIPATEDDIKIDGIITNQELIRCL
ncbi:5-formyltetrahydrofolate cyclo-ligase [Peptococcaceae bacterium 1198_IL3148]